MPIDTKSATGNARTEPFFIVPKNAHAAILCRVEGTDATYCLAVYDATRRLANDARSANGPAILTINQIAAATGCSYRKAANCLRVLRSVGVLGVENQQIAGTKSRAPSSYTFPTLGTLCLTLGTELHPTRAQLSEEQKEQKESCAPAVAAEISSKGPKVRPRNPLLDVLVALDGSDVTQATSRNYGKAAKALAEIKPVCAGVTEAELRRRAYNYRLHYPQAAISALALADHWALCDTPPSGRNRDEPPLRMIQP